MDNNDIIYEDFSNLKEDIFVEKFELWKKTIKHSGEFEKILLNLEGTFLSSNITKLLGELFEDKLIGKQAVAFLGINSGVRKLILQTFDYPLYIAIDKEEGFEWLLDQ